MKNTTFLFLKSIVLSLFTPSAAPLLLELLELLLELLLLDPVVGRALELELELELDDAVEKRRGVLGDLT